ncbi:hypothetical protein N7462_010633 [Penicillium macrosclerotiorum]|uniref:uncharacterized protein n=1 Tax=Penicillium macrosclerotiorum TaxID=303699 RepID=UPI0025492DB0|nr:uncharacterized protein N7462_010633 [Penicillium macrosclerotiorum]KAJ5669563.1 hypothetical protein N7462_010633 [Penicillium macrosclerotiorum]
MSCNLWQYFIQDDVESFQRLLSNATFAGPRTGGSLGTAAVVAANLSSKTGSPGSMIAASPNPPKQRKTSVASPSTSAPDRPALPRAGTALSRADVNARDHYGRTLLHHVASSPKPSAASFAHALLQIPFLDIYAQDWESGWTALHRALYAGNATIARALMARDMRDVTDFSKIGNTSHPSGSLIKMKDREGYSPFDVYGATITSRDIKQVASSVKWPGSTSPDVIDSDIVSNAPSNEGEEGDDDLYVARVALKTHTNFSADEVFTLGSNKNLNLGLGDQDDRQFPERITLKRPDHLLHRFYREYGEDIEKLGLEDTIDSTFSDLPTLITNKPIKYQNIVMSKLHTAIITDDPEANLFICGFGPGGRLGTGDESTRFSFVCIETGGLAGKKVMSVALGQDHSLAITEFGEIFSWGSNKFGQLGYSLPRTNNRNDVPIQTTPRQIFNPFKKEIIIGAAASSIHSVVFSTSGLYTFGKNEGQLGLVDSDARSLEVQVTPRRVGASLFKSPIQTVSAIDRATSVLLQNHEVWVFSQYGYSKISFPLEASSKFIRDSFMATRYDTSANRIIKLASGGNTICALSSSGEVFTVQVNKSDDPSAQTSTTNPAKIRNSLATPVRAWSVKKSHMAANDVDVGQDGSIIICTTSGSAWRKEKRTKNKEGAAKEYKFARIPGLSRAVAVRSNAFGAYAVAQRDCDVTKEQIHIDQSTLWDDLLPLSPFLTPGIEDVDTILSDETQDIVPLSPVIAMKKALLLSSEIETHFLAARSDGTIWITSSLSDQRMPVHEFLLAGRSPILRNALQEFHGSYYASMPDVFDIGYGKDGIAQVRLLGVDFLTVMNIVFFLYTDNILDVWHQARSSPENAARFRQVRTEVMKVATHLSLPTLERAARLMVEPTKSLNTDMAHALNHPSFFDDADVIVRLNGENLKIHSQVACQRCPFFDALFHGRSGGRWLASRRQESSEKVEVNLEHIDRSTFDFVLQYMYADTDEPLFDQVRTKTLDGLIDLLLDVMYVANELMIDRLSQICQKMLGRFVNTRSISYLLNSVAPIYVTEFKEAALEYICLNLEDMLANRYLEDLDEDLLGLLDTVCHENQTTCFPVSRGRNSEEYLLEKYPEIISSVEMDRRRRIDAMALQSRLSQVESYDVRPRPPQNDMANASPLARKAKGSITRDETSSSNTPILKPRQSTGDLMFQMDEEALLSPGDSIKGKMAMRGLGIENRSYPDSPTLAASIPEAGSPNYGRSLDEIISSPRERLLAESPTESRATALHSKRVIGSPLDSLSAPWGSSVISSNKKDLKDIMGETAQSRVSNLTLEMSEVRRENSSSFAPKMSQKERKKMQQQQMQDKLAAEQQAADARKNPWQLPSPATPTTTPTTPGKVPITVPSSGSSTPVSESGNVSQKPAMTLRQTVAGTPPPRSKPVATPIPSQSRSVSSTQVQSPSKSKPSPPGPPTPSQQSLPKSPQPAIQSIRHIPRPDPYTLDSRSPSHGSLSLATILLQQQSEKDEIREAATAKHNLEEIQAEQEFQQWWDQESKRVQGLLEPEPNEQRGSRGGRSGKALGAGSSRKRRGNKNIASEGSGFQGQKQQTAVSHSPTTPKKNTNGSIPVQRQNQTGPNTSSPAPGKNTRRGGHAGPRGKGKDRN